MSDKEHLKGNKQGPRSIHLAVMVKPGLKAKLAASAKAQFRSVSQQAAYYITEGLKRDGFIVTGEKEGL
jgi:hypothetical protein